MDTDNGRPRRATLPELAELEAAGFTVSRELGGFTLTDPDGAYLMIGSHGCVSPTQWEAVAEGLARAEADRHAEAAFRRRCAELDAARPPAPLFDAGAFRQLRGQMPLSWDGEPLLSPSTVAEAGAELESE